MINEPLLIPKRKKKTEKDKKKRERKSSTKLRESTHTGSDKVKLK